MAVDFTKKRNRKFLSNNKPDKTVEDAKRVLDTVKWEDCAELLERCRELYDKGQTMRDKMRRCTNYTQGYQWKDYITDPDSEYEEKISEENYIKRQGLVPLQYNIMKKSMKTTCGLFSKSIQPPTVGAKGDHLKKLSDMVSCALKSAYQQNHVGDYVVSALEEAWQKGMFLLSVRYVYDHERGMSDIKVQNEDFYKLIIDNNLHDKQLKDLKLIGMIRDMPFEELASQFARSRQEVEELATEYRYVSSRYSGLVESFEARHRYGGTADSFYCGNEPDLCRVYEIWTLEREESLYCHDFANAEEYYLPYSKQMEESLQAQNAMRIAQALMMGLTEEDAEIIDYRWEMRTFWYVRYLTPTGKCIRGQETPYDHNSHPFIIGAFPMVDGEIHSPAEEMIDVQRALNRTLSQVDFIRQRGAKNCVMINKNNIPKEINWRDFEREYSRNGSMLILNMKPGDQYPQQLKTAQVSQGDVEMVNLYKGFADEISGVTGALRGERASADTPASLYAQQAENSESNIAYFMKWFWSLANDLFWKMVKLQQQYYDEGRYLPLAGNEYSEEAHFYKSMDIKGVDLYLEIVDANSVTFFKDNFERTLSMALQTQAIDFMTYLQCSRAPFASALSEKISEMRARVESMQQEGQQTLPSGNM